MKKHSVTIGVAFLALLLLAVLIFGGTAQNVVAQTQSTNNQSASASASDDWSMFRQNPQRTGISSSPAPNGNLLWRFNTDLPYNSSYPLSADRLRSSPTVAGGVLYFGSNNTYYYALNASSGSLIWRVDVGCRVISSAAVVDGVVYVGLLFNTQAYVDALNATTGSIIWQYAVANNFFESCPAVVNGVVYIGSYVGYVYALNATNGDLIWTYLTGGSVYSSPAVVDGVVYIGSYDGNVYALDAANGAVRWVFQAGNPVYSSPAVVDNVVYANSDNGTLFALRTSDGSKIWKAFFGSGTDHADDSPAVAYGAVYVGARNGYYAFNASDGSQIWFFTSPYSNRAQTGYVYSSPAVAAGVVYFGSWDNYVFALNASNGNMVWSYCTGGFLFTSPAIANGVLYIGSYDGYVYALGGESVIVPTPTPQPSTNEWPMYRHDSQRTGKSDSNVSNGNGNLIWCFDTGVAYTSSSPSDADRMRASPTVAGGVLYFGYNNVYYYALNATDGSLIWQVNIGSKVISTAAVFDGVVYFGTLYDSHGYTIALNAADGSIIWRFATGNGIESSPTVINGVVYIGASNGVYALNASTGALKWSSSFTGCIGLSSPSIVDNVLYIGAFDGNVYALNANTGAKIWAFQTGNSIESSPAVVNGVLYITSDNGTLYALKANNGLKIWKACFGSGSDHAGDSPAVDNGFVYVGSRNGYYAFNATDGSQIWFFVSPYSTRLFSGWVYSSPAVAGNVLYYGSSDNYVFALNAHDGSIIWTYKTGGYLFTSPAVVNGKVYIGSFDGKIYALGTSSIPSTTPIPTPIPQPTASPSPTPTSKPTSQPTATHAPMQTQTSQPTPTPNTDFQESNIYSDNQPARTPIRLARTDENSSQNLVIFGVVVAILVIVLASLLAFSKRLKYGSL
jgi:eukaryotic-like serine/threonine-protein kinase